MYLIVGLGNPGRQYENTRHNIGFHAIDYLASELGIKVDRIKHRALVGEGRLGGEKVMLMKPQTYMNLSGEAVREAASYYKIEPENILVIYDDIDIGLGELRLRSKGSAGTHNGMKSIIYQLKSDSFPRLRIGIGRGDAHIPLGDYVLGGFTKGEVAPLEEAIKRGASAIETYIKDGIDVAMSRHNQRKAGKDEGR